MKNFLLGLMAVLLLFLSQTSHSQSIPSYVPQNGLVGWWPFNGNANDESGNGNNGTVNGATLTMDRFGNANKAYSFDGVNDFISMNNAPLTNFPFTLSGWIKCNVLANDPMISLGEYGTTNQKLYFTPSYNGTGKPSIGTAGANEITSKDAVATIGNWHHVVVVVNSYNTNSVLFYFDGKLLSGNTTKGTNIPFPLNNTGFTIGKHSITSGINFANASIDDIAIWNRALTEQEIKNIYNGNICYQNVTVTDTLLINTTITGFNPITYQNTIKVFPNPSKDQITIDFGNFNTLNGYQLKITNSIGQQMYQTAINKQSVNISLGSWTGKGLYFIQIIDGNGNTIETRKILIQ